MHGHAYYATYYILLSPILQSNYGAQEFKFNLIHVNTNEINN